jgi:PAS domain S-box-containing protein
MRIGYKLISGYVLIAALSGVTMYLANRSYHQIDRTFDALSSDSIPEIEALEELKIAALRIVASTSEHALIEAESKGDDHDSTQATTERDLISSGVENYNNALVKYEPLVDQNSREREDQQKIRKCGGDLIRISLELVNSKRQGMAGSEVLEKKEEFEQAEQKFLAVVNEALVFQHAQLDEKTEMMHSTIATSKSLTLIVFCLTLGFSLAIGLYISRSISRPVNQLKDASREIGKGKLDTRIDIRSNDEIGELAASFNKMTADLRQSQLEILATKHFVDNIIRSMTDLLIVTDVDGNITRTNTAATTLLGYQANALVGKALETILETKGTTHGGDLRAIESTGSVESRCKRADDSEIPVLFSASIIRDLQGHDLGFVCIAQDITELKEVENELRISLNEKEVLLKEIHHRVKNNLQVISSLLNLQARHLKDPEAQIVFRESQDRVKSMGLIHETLYQSKDFSKIKFDEYIQKLIAYISRSYKVTPHSVKIDHAIGDIALGIDSAVPCGLLINELVSNALKHAFPEGRKGKVTVALDCIENDYRLIVSDDGVGFAAKTEIGKSNSLGLKLVASLTDQLGGQLELCHAVGTKFTITFPKATN